jgi:ATP-dependent DNA helicase RecQ
MNHVIEVLTGADTEKVRKWGHTRLSTYGIGRELSRSEWAGVGRELLRLGFVAVAEGEFATIEITATGAEALRDRRTITLTKPMEKPTMTRRAPARRGEIECDETLFEELRRVRKRLADERGVPAYIVCGDVTLRELARFYPTTPEALANISGLGQKKLAEFGEVFAQTIAGYLAAHPRQEFDE